MLTLVVCVILRFFTIICSVVNVCKRDCELQTKQTFIIILFRKGKSSVVGSLNSLPRYILRSPPNSKFISFIISDLRANVDDIEKNEATVMITL